MAAPADEGIPELVREAIDNAVQLARAEIEFAKAEALSAMLRFALAAAFFVVALLLLLFVLIFALGAVPTFLAGVVFSGWVWWLLTAAFFLLLALAVLLIGYRRLRRGIGATTTLIASLKEDIAWLKGLTRRNAGGS